MSCGLGPQLHAAMVALLRGPLKIAGSLPIADWYGIASSATAMRASYVFEQKLTATQRRELDKLPEQFKSLDEAFHLRAEKLEQAAQVKDAKAVSVEFTRLLDMCVACHSTFAKQRFPNFR